MSVRSTSGIVLLEMVICLGPLLAAVATFWELHRRAQIEVAVQQTAFLFARDRALGRTRGTSVRAARAFFRRALGQILPDVPLGQLRLDTVSTSRGMDGRVWFRFPMLWRVFHRHHYEVTRRCPFFLLMASLLMGMGPVWTHSLFRTAYQWQSHQIALDNATIRLGRRLRTLLNELNIKEHSVLGLESVHHVAHACARVPSPKAAGCLAKDQISETAIRSLIETQHARAKLAWAAHLAQFRVGLGERRLCRFEGPSAFPLSLRYCPVCRLAVGWQVRSIRFDFELCHRAYRSIHAGLVFQRRVGRWNYQLIGDWQ